MTHADLLAVQRGVEVLNGQSLHQQDLRGNLGRGPTFYDEHNRLQALLAPHDLWLIQDVDAKGPWVIVTRQEWEAVCRRNGTPEDRIGRGPQWEPK